MSARPVASVGLFLIGVVTFAGAAVRKPIDIFIVMGHQSPIPKSTLQALQHETSILFDGGYRVQWMMQPREVAGEFLVFVDFEGRCEAAPPSPTTVPRIARRLASTAIADGRILPFIGVNCTALSELLTPALNRNPDAARLYGKALARLLAHELYHVVGQAEKHSGAGIAQSAVSRQDLLRDDFRFDADALRTIFPPSAPISDSSNTPNSQ